MRKTLSLAAGGLLLRETGAQREIALVHRPKYDDWTLPKGKLEDAESPEAAALREVREETGCEPVLGEFVGVVHYELEHVHKVVLFWLMSATLDAPQPLASDVDQCLWVPLAQARAMLTHQLERDLLAGIALDDTRQPAGRASS
jgi:8-oxo-dGTP diphosphatase